MDKIKIVFLDMATLERGDVGLERFTNKWDCSFHPATSYEDTRSRIVGAQVAVTNKVIFDREIIFSPEAANLRLIAIAATGTNNVDLAAAKEKGAAVCNVVGYSTQSVVQHTLGFILEFASNICRYSEDTRSGAWENSKTFTMLTRQCIELAGKKLGIIGYGKIGSAVAEAAGIFGMEILIAARPGAKEIPPGRISIEEILKTADFISLHCPLTPETKGLIGYKELSMMKNSSYLINVARGGIVDEEALVRAMKEKIIAGAGVDVLTTEPPDASHCLISAAKELENMLITPHTAWTAREARCRLLDEIAENIASFIKGVDRNRVA